MTTLYRFLLPVNCAIALSCISFAFAQTAPDNNNTEGKATPVVAEPTKDPFAGVPKTGVIASYSSGGGGKAAGGFDKLPLDEDSIPPLAGSVVKKGTQGWEVTFKNNSPKSVSAQVKVTQLTNTQKAVKTDYLSFSVPANSSQSKLVSSGVSSNDCTVEITRWTAGK
jgi:hypothetical protein